MAGRWVPRIDELIVEANYRPKYKGESRSYAMLLVVKLTVSLLYEYCAELLTEACMNWK